MTTGEQVGEVIHFYGKINVGVLRCVKPLKMGDKVHFLGSHTDFEQEITSMQMEHEAVEEVASGDEVLSRQTTACIAANPSLSARPGAAELPS